MTDNTGHAKTGSVFKVTFMQKTCKNYLYINMWTCRRHRDLHGSLKITTTKI